MRWTAFPLCLLPLGLSVGWAQVPIAQVQGRELRSPMEGQWVTVRGVVTGVAGSGFFLQDPNPDDDPLTSEGIFVYTGNQTPPVEVGRLVEVRGRVQEYIPSGDPAAPPLTELVSPTVTPLVGQVALPPAVELSPLFPDPSGDLHQLEAVEGMRVRVALFVVTGPSAGRLEEVSATSSSTGVFYGTVSGLKRPFREPGFPPFDPVPSGNPPKFDGNPEVLRVESACLLGQSPASLAAGTLVEGLTGPLTVASRRYTLCPEAGWRVVHEPPLPEPPPPPRGRQLLLASWNLQRFFDDADDPYLGEPVLTPAAFARRLGKLAQGVFQFLHRPQVLVVQEVESVRVLQELAGQLELLATAIGEPSPQYQVVLSPVSDPGGLRLGALVARRGWGLELFLRWWGVVLAETYLENPDGSREALFDRPPLVLELELGGQGLSVQRLTVVGVHLRSLLGLLSSAPGANGWPTEGARVRAKRARQAEELGRWVERYQSQNPTVPLVILGDFNAFEFSDGVVDVVGTVAGTPAPPQAVALPTPDVVSEDLTILTLLEAEGQRYSYVFDGSAQALDHALASRSLSHRGWRGQLFRPRLAADFADTVRNTTSPFRLSDHDPLLVVLTPPVHPRRWVRSQR
ncbi:MAG: hypothetical protein NZ869_01235 [Thermoanaerobaculum sp.]|nr:hypothetical protein [Thermoanaerobaculum sp.]